MSGRGYTYPGFSTQSAAGRKNIASSNELSSMGVGGAMGFAQARSIGSSKHRHKDQDDYFDDDEPNEPQALYQPAPGSPSAVPQDKDSDSDDPLDAFMAGVESECIKQKEIDEAKLQKKKGQPSKKAVRDDLEEEDDQESFFRYMEENPMAGVNPEDDNPLVEYDAEGNAILPEKKAIDPLPPIDHSEILYLPFNKNFYTEHEEISTLDPVQVSDLRIKLGIKVTGVLPAKPVTSFAHFGFDENLLKIIRKLEYTQPTPIQAQGVPIALGGRDIIGIAKTGSGKTAAFIWPLLVHIMDQRELQPGDGPIGVILAPTRELSQQIYTETKRFGKAYNIKVVCAYGGGSMYEQQKACQEGAEIIVATPGRLIDLVKRKATNLQRVTYLVFDEADRMFDLGFEPQVRSIANHVRPNRQTLLFSATFRYKIERLVREIMTDPIRVVQGDIGEANEDITQIVSVMTQPSDKWSWLTSRLVQLCTIGSVLIFVTRKDNSEELSKNLKLNDHKVGLLHGDMNQVERNDVTAAFKRKEFPILVATDVAARGLDIPHIKTVINYDVARDIDTHTHRIGRTGRAGEKGTAYTLVAPKDKEFAGHLVRNLEAANQHVPQPLMELAVQCPWFEQNRFKASQAKRLNKEGGLGKRERPMLGGGSSGQTFTHYQPGAVRERGPQSDRVSAMKQAFAAQFRSNFVQSSEKPADPQYTEPDQPKKKKSRPSRWDV